MLTGDVKIFPATVKVPHMGWNQIEIVQESPFLREVVAKSFVYFVHSYLAQNTRQHEVVASSTYAGQFVPGLVQKENVTGMQFHPEKSGPFGKYLLSKWVQQVQRGVINHDIDRHISSD